MALAGSTPQGRGVPSQPSCLPRLLRPLGALSPPGSRSAQRSPALRARGSGLPSWKPGGTGRILPPPSGDSAAATAPRWEQSPRRENPARPPALRGGPVPAHGMGFFQGSNIPLSRCPVSLCPGKRPEASPGPGHRAADWDSRGREAAAGLENPLFVP